MLNKIYKFTTMNHRVNLKTNTHTHTHTYTRHTHGYNKKYTIAQKVIHEYSICSFRVINSNMCY